jgi:tetratricopeptide (TPR) repeat protein
MATPDEAEELLRKGHEAVNRGHYIEARKISKTLLRMRFTGGFEIAALNLQKAGKPKAAVRILERGVRKGPKVWLLWQLLGNLRSDLGDFDGASKDYDRALACPNVNPSSVHLNRAILMDRQGKYEESINALVLVQDEDLSLRADAVRLGLLNGMERYEEAAELAKAILDELSTSEEGAELVASVKADLGLAIWKAKGDRESALQFAYAAIDSFPNCKQALWLIREIEGKKSSRAKHLCVIVQGTIGIVDNSENGFYQTFDVVADNEREALGYIRRLFPAEIQVSLRIDEFEEKGPKPTEPKGVYRLSARFYFDEAENDAHPNEEPRVE